MKKQDIESIVASYGPFEIIDLLNSLSPKRVEKLVDELKAPEKKSSIAQLMYFQKYLDRYTPDFSKAIQSIAVGNHHGYVAEIHELPYSISGFGREECQLIYKNLGAFQFTHGCGGRCKFCCLDAALKVRDRVPFEHQISLLKEVGKVRAYWHKAPLTYWANDFLDIIKTPTEYLKFCETYEKAFDRSIPIRTCIPAGTEELYKILCRGNKKELDNLVISISEQNIARLSKKGITKIDSLNKIKSWDDDATSRYFSENEETIQEIFNEEFAPDKLSIRYEHDMINAGINRYDLQKNPDNSNWDMASTLIAPYGVYNIVPMGKMSKTYPQGCAIVALDKIGEKPFKIVIGERIEPLLRNAIASGKPHSNEENSYFLENLSYKIRIQINNLGIITGSR